MYLQKPLKSVVVAILVDTEVIDLMAFPDGATVCSSPSIRSRIVVFVRPIDLLPILLLDTQQLDGLDEVIAHSPSVELAVGIQNDAEPCRLIS